MKKTLVWVEIEQGKTWRSIDGRYAIVAVTLPETPPHTEYLVRKIDPAMAAAYPSRQTLGYHIDIELDINAAKATAERDAWADAHWDTRSVPEDLPSVALERFFWPISNGTNRAGLAVVKENGRLYARVVGMCREGEDDPHFVVGTFAEIDLDDAVLHLSEG